MGKRNVAKSKTFLAALKLGVVEDTSDKWVDPMKECVRGVEFEGEFTCRTWALAALYDLASQRFIGMIAD